MSEQIQSYAIADLLAMDDGALNALAAELRGWHYPSPQELKKGAWPGYDKGDGSYMEAHKWRPATDLNQSRDLLRLAIDKTGNCFNVSTQPDGSFVEIVWVAPGGDTTEIPFNCARGETAAFCAVMLAEIGMLKL